MGLKPFAGGAPATRSGVKSSRRGQLWTRTASSPSTIHASPPLPKKFVAHRGSLPPGCSALSVGAVAARPDSTHMSSDSKCFVTATCARCFVTRSAGFTKPCTLCSPMRPDAIWSCSQRYLTLTCRSLPRPDLRTIPIAALASVCTVASTAPQRSASSVTKPSASAAPLL